MKSILLTGGAGYIGSHTCFLLLQRGYNVFVIDSFVNSSPESLKRVLKILNKQKVSFSNRLYVFKGDLRDKAFIKKIFEFSKEIRKEIKSVIHLAGLKSVKESILNPTKYWDFNVNSTINLVETMSEFNCSTIVFSSSASIYKNQSINKSLDERSEIKPTNPYGKSKFAIESLLKDVYGSYPNNWKIINLRYFNPIGAHSSGMIGEDPMGIPNNIFPILTRVAIGKIKELEIYGNNWPTLDGTPIRDYIHVMDLADSHVFSLDYLHRFQSKFLSLNIGTGKGTSVLELINIFQKVNNLKIPYVFRDRREGDNAILVAKNKLASKLLNWIPKRSIEDMCIDGWKWQIKNPNGYN